MATLLTATVTDIVPGPGSADEPAGPRFTDLDWTGPAHSGDTAGAAELWDALFRARAHYSPRVLAAAEDKVFQLYRPLARALAHRWASSTAGALDFEQAAELGLAEAVLGWPRSDGRTFEAYAGVVIAAQLRRSTLVYRSRDRRHADDTAPAKARAMPEAT